MRNNTLGEFSDLNWVQEFRLLWQSSETKETLKNTDSYDSHTPSSGKYKEVKGSHGDGDLLAPGWPSSLTSFVFNYFTICCL